MNHVPRDKKIADRLKKRADGSDSLHELVGLNETNSECQHYNWGVGYPSAYGARCEKLNEFFSKDKTGRLEPNCSECMKSNREITCGGEE